MYDEGVVYDEFTPPPRPRKRKQRTLEEALAGVPARKYYRNDIDIQRRTADGKRYAPRIKRNANAQPNEGHFKGGRIGGKRNWSQKLDPNSPNFDRELAIKHFKMLQENGKKGAKARRGVPKGWRSREWRPYFAKRLEFAQELVNRMANRGLVDFDETALERDITTDEGKCAVMLDYAVAVAITPDVSIRDRLAHARTVLEFLKQKPVAKSDVALNVAEDLLAKIAADEGI